MKTMKILYQSQYVLMAVLFVGLTSGLTAFDEGNHQEDEGMHEEHMEHDHNEEHPHDEDHHSAH